jgi:metal-responsive CopG/Arc/MetJ family transcriptional regulator
MPSTTVHIPDQLLSKIDQIVKEKTISRNRFIVQACEQALNNSVAQWPEGFFESELNGDNLMLLTEGVSEMEEAIISMRKNRGDVAL